MSLTERQKPLYGRRQFGLVESVPAEKRGEAVNTVVKAPVVEMTSTSWAAGNLGLSAWNEAGRRLGSIGRGIGWWIGDWLLYGNRRFGERYARARRITGYDVQTLMNMVYVASRFEPSRRRQGLSFSHHAELAPLDLEAQERWLSQAEAERFSVRCLREELRRERRLATAEPLTISPPLPDPSHEFVCPQCGVRMQSAAEAA